jgi:hypothetical protein
MLNALHSCIVWAQAHGVLPPHGVMPAGFLIAIWIAIQAIFSVVATIASFVADAGELVFTSIVDVAEFAARGVVWLAGTIRDGFEAFLQSTEKFLQDLPQNLKNLWNDVLDKFAELKAALEPELVWLNWAMQVYVKYWKEFVQPVLNIISRVRQALQIFKFFGLQWAQQLDIWLQDVQQQIIKNTQVIQQQLTMITNWANAIGDPFGLLRTNPVLGGFVNGLDQFWAAMFGTPFFGAPGSGGFVNSTASLGTTFAAQVAQLQSGTGDAGDIQARAPGIRAALYAEMSVTP